MKLSLDEWKCYVLHNLEELVQYFVQKIEFIKKLLNREKSVTSAYVPLLQVQESVASCLPPLVPAIKEDAGDMVRKLLQLLLESDKYAERKGAAYGLAGLVKGLGILSLKQQDIMTTLTDAIQDKKNARCREGECFVDFL